MCLGVPAQIVSIPDETQPRALVSVAGVERVVATDLLVDAPSVGDWVLVHVGFALATLDAAEAAETLEAIRALGTFDDEVASFARTASL